MAKLSLSIYSKTFGYFIQFQGESDAEFAQLNSKPEKLRRVKIFTTRLAALNTLRELEGALEEGDEDYTPDLTVITHRLPIYFNAEYTQHEIIQPLANINNWNHTSTAGEYIV